MNVPNITNLKHNKNSIIAFILFLVSITPIFAKAESLNAGFVQGIWYSENEIFADKPVRIYVAIRNNTGSDITSTVDFFDNGKRIERNNVSALDGRIIESWADWTPTFGEHTITATLSRIELHTIGSSTKEIEVVSASSSDTFFVDHDTDNDGLGNQIDTDDDNDGISDETENKNGTDPLDPNDPKIETETIDKNTDAETVAYGGDNEVVAAYEQSGLEKYIEQPQLHSVLSTLTKQINQLKTDLDSYRTMRQDTKTANSAAPSDTDDKKESAAFSTDKPLSSLLTTSGNLLGTGTVSGLNSSYQKISKNLVNDEETKPNHKDGREKSETPGLLDTVKNIAVIIFGGLYTGVLYLLSLYLSYPALVQISLLLLLLFLLYRVTKRLACRPDY